MVEQELQELWSEAGAVATKAIDELSSPATQQHAVPSNVVVSPGATSPVEIAPFAETRPCPLRPKRRFLLRALSIGLACVLIGIAFGYAGRLVERPPDEAATTLSPRTPFEEASSAYKALIDAFNKLDAEAYYDGFGNPIRCFYNARNYSVESLRKSGRNSRFANRDASDLPDPFPLGTLELKSSGNSEVSFWVNRGTRKNEKLIVMERINGRWLVVVEAGPGSQEHGCVDYY